MLCLCAFEGVLIHLKAISELTLERFKNQKSYNKILTETYN